MDEQYTHMLTQLYYLDTDRHRHTHTHTKTFVNKYQFVVVLTLILTSSAGRQVLLKC